MDKKIFIYLCSIKIINSINKILAVMKKTSFLCMIIISSVLLCCCDNQFNKGNEGNGNKEEEIEDYITGNPAYEHTNEGTVMYWGKDTYGGFYGFIDGGQRHYLENSKNKIIDVYVSKDNVYTLSWDNSGEKEQIVLWKNTEKMYEHLDDIFCRDKFFVDIHNDNVRIYSEIPFEFDVSGYTPKYWENNQYYKVDLEMITYSSLPLFSQPQGIIRAYGDTYHYGFMWCVNGKLPCIWKNGKIIMHADDTLNTTIPAAGFCINKRNDVTLLNYYTYEDYANQILPGRVPATYNIKGELINIYGDTAKLFRSKYEYNMFALDLIKYDDDIYVCCEEDNGTGAQRSTYVYKNDKLYYQKYNCRFLDMCISKGDTYIAIKDLNDGKRCMILKNGEPYVNNFQLGTTEIYGLAVLPAGLGQPK